MFPSGGTSAVYFSKYMKVCNQNTNVCIKNMYVMTCLTMTFEIYENRNRSSDVECSWCDGSCLNDASRS